MGPQCPHRKENKEEEISQSQRTGFISALLPHVASNDQNATHEHRREENDADDVGEFLMSGRLEGPVARRLIPRVKDAEENWLSAVSSSLHAFGHTNGRGKFTGPGRACVGIK